MAWTDRYNWHLTGDSDIKLIQVAENYLTTPAAPAPHAMGAVTALIPEAHMTGILTALEMAYAAAKVGEACN
jgi:hypothetical protein